MDREAHLAFPCDGHDTVKAPNPWGWVTEERLTYALKLLLVIVLALYLGGLFLAFLDRIRAVVAIVIGSVFFAYLIYPLVTRLRRRVPLIAAIAIVYVGILAVVAIVGAFLVPRLTDDVTSLVAHYPQLVGQLNAALNDPNNPVVGYLPESLRGEVAKLPTQAVDWLRIHGIEAAGRAMTIVLGTFAAVATFVIIPLFTAYLLMDLERLRNGLERIVPPSRWQATLGFLQEIDRIIGGFVRGQILVALIVGLLLTIALLIMHVRYAFLLGLLAAVGDLIPYVGAVLVFVPAISIALLNNGWVNALIVAALFLAIYEVEGHLIAPTIVSSQVKLSPLIVLVAILVGGEVGGIVGMLVAVPIAGVLRAIVLRAIAPAKAPVVSGAKQQAP